MNIIDKVTLKNLMKNKVRTIVTIIGIILSAAMICAVTILVSSLQQYMINMTIDEMGNWYGNCTAITQDELDALKSNEKISTVIEAQSIGYSEIEDYRWENAKYIYFMGVENDFAEEMSIKIEKGRMPENENEIILPLHLLRYESLEGKIKTGEEITFNIGKRYSGGKILGQLNSYIEDEVLLEQEQKTYIVVGFYEKPGFESLFSPGYTAITMAEENTTKNCLYDVYFRTKKPSDFYSLYNSYDFKIRNNGELLMYYGQFEISSFSSLLFSMSTIVICIIMFGSISLIYNSFAMSVSERTKQFGLLSSIGATKNQLKKSVLFEAVTLSVIGIPLGILSGIGGIWITLMLVGEKFVAFFNSDIPMRLKISPLSIIIAVTVAFITVLISAWIPSKRATKVSAIEAIRLNNDVKIKNKKLKSNKLIHKLFGFEGMIAEKYYKRSKKKYRATVISLFMSIVLFITTGSFCDYLKSSVEMAENSDKYDIVTNIYLNNSNKPLDNISEENKKDNLLEIITSDLPIVNNIFNKMSKADDIKKASLAFEKKYKVQLPMEYVADDYIENINQEMLIGDSLNLSTYICFIDDDMYKLYLKENNLDEAVYYDANNPKAICYMDNLYFDYNVEKFKKLKLLKDGCFELNAYDCKKIAGYRFDYTGIDESIDGNKLYAFYKNIDNANDVIKKELSEVIELKYNHKIGYTTYEKPMFISSSGTFMFIIYPQSFMDKILKNETFEQNRYYQMFVTSSNHTNTYKSIKSIYNEFGMPEDWYINIFDKAYDIEMEKNALLIVNVFSYGFITLITLIAVANVFNTISTNILLRKKDFAMLKSVGMTNNGFNKMLRFECILYGIKSLILGIPVAISATILIYVVVQDAFEVDFTLPYKQIIISILSVFLVVFITMMYAIKKIKKEDPIDNLRNENI